MIKKYAFPFLITGTVVMIFVMIKTGAVLKTPSTPFGIIDLEFAYNEAKALFIYDTWAMVSSTDLINSARLNTWLDFIFLFFYSLLLNFSVNKLSAAFKGPMSNAGKLIAKGALLAGALDIIENAGMLTTLGGNISNAIAMITCLAAFLKWILVLLAVFYLFFGGLAFFSAKMKRPRPL